MSEQARRNWATAAAYGWFVGYGWIGLVLSVAANRLIAEPGERASSPLVTIVAVAGGAALGYWQARHRLAVHENPETPPLRFFPLLVCAWLGAIGAALLISV
ncbi:hypothetical protein [Euzebya tangerina]|uniref:hypothetical protein n=1 Tax=Euzebya tangerina TaxID=591198 RepID=UPI0013C30AB3|nr:hypothetical protein [Euzebya tangerina]